jgi:hypothetical protein
VTWLAWRLHGSKVCFAAGVALLALTVMASSVVVMSSGASNDLKIWATLPVFQVLLLVIVAPALLGMFLGAPLVATELENGLHRLAWAQSVSRRRWLLVHMGLVLGSVIVVMAAVGAVMYWGLQAIDLGPATTSQANVPLQPTFFDGVAIAPAAYGAFAVALGVALGTVTRRTMLAMFLVLVLFTAVRVGIAAAARPNYEPPLHAVVPMSAMKIDGKGGAVFPSGQSVPAGAFILDQHVVDASGRVVNIDLNAANCGQAGECGSYRVLTDYQPADRFWTFQLVEAAIYVALTALLLSLTYWQVVRRLT